MEKFFSCSNLKKSYFQRDILKGIRMEVDKGKIVGLLGPSGSGKTTLLKIIAGISKCSSGEVLIDGVKPGIETKSKVSYLPDRNFLYKWMRVKDSIEFFKDFYKDFDEERCNKLIKFMDLNIKSKITSLPKGELEKLLLTLVFCRKSKLYLLDEPLSIVDLITRDKILDIIMNNYTVESSIIIATNLVENTERVFDQVFFIDKGKIILSGNVEDLKMKKGKSIADIYRELFNNEKSY